MYENFLILRRTAHLESVCFGIVKRLRPILFTANMGVVVYSTLEKLYVIFVSYLVILSASC